LTHFTEPDKSIGSFNAQAAARLLTAAADLTLVVDAQGVICDLSVGAEALPASEDWIGRKWIDTVTVESRGKVEELIREAKTGALSRARHINHRLAASQDLPIRYSAIQIGRGGRIVALGHELRPLAQLQQRLVEAQRTTEQEFLRLRSAETRFRILFQLANEAVLIADATSLRTIDANPAAATLLETTSGKMVGRSLVDIFDETTRSVIEPQLSAIRSIGRIEGLRVRVGNGRECWLSAALIRQDDSAQIILRLTPLAEVTGAGLPLSKLHMLRALEGMPDAILLVDQDRCVLDANHAFLELAQIPSLTQAKGQSVERWIGRSGVDLNVLFANLREHGTMRNFATTLRSDFGYSEDVELSGICMPGGENPTYAFIIRMLARQLRVQTVASAEHSRSAEQLSELVGRVPLKDLVRETTEITEKLCIEAALKLTGDNRAAAAQMLGLSRQSLYGKLRRYGIGDLADDAEAGEDASE
jgi:transcriptional regulator PpsR